MNVTDLLEHVDTVTAAAAAVGCTGGVCVNYALGWWKKRAPIRAARRARRRARREARHG